jgi:hypothetical protein
LRRPAQPPPPIHDVSRLKLWSSLAEPHGLAFTEEEFGTPAAIDGAIHGVAVKLELLERTERDDAVLDAMLQLAVSVAQTPRKTNTRTRTRVTSQNELHESALPTSRTSLAPTIDVPCLNEA